MDMSKGEHEKKVTKENKKQLDDREEEHTPLEQHEEHMFVDDIPLEDLKIEADQEKNKHKTQDDSQSTNEK